MEDTNNVLIEQLERCRDIFINELIKYPDKAKYYYNLIKEHVRKI